MNVMFAHQQQTTIPPLSSPKPLLPGIWQTLASSGIPWTPEQMIPSFGRLSSADEEKPIPSEQIIRNDRIPAPKKRKRFKRSVFSEGQKQILIEWLHSHQSNPYPTLLEKQELMQETGLNRDQINVWFTNNRIRHGLTGIHAHQTGKGETRSRGFVSERKGNC